MSRLGGQFAGIVQVEVSGGQGTIPRKKRSQTLDAHGLTIVVHVRSTPGDCLPVAQIFRKSSARTVRELSREISHTLAESGVNVEELHTELASAAMSGETLFKAHAVLSIPDSCDVAGSSAKTGKNRG